VFIDPSRVQGYLVNTLGSSLAAIQYKIDYSRQYMGLRHPDSSIEHEVHSLKLGRVNVWDSRNTSAQLYKVKARANLLDLEIYQQYT
jgi:hypothetical protein